MSEINIFNDYIQEMINKQKQVKTKEYLEWLINFIEKAENNFFTDEDAAYNDNLDVSDKNKATAISYYFTYVKKKGEEQSVFTTEIDDEESIFFMSHDMFYEIWLIVGQGAITGIRKVTDEIPESFVIMDRDLTQQEKKDIELIEYIVVNKDLNMSAGKIAAQVGHVCGMCAEKQSLLPKYKKWKDSYDFKKIVLAGHQKDLEKLKEQNFFYVIDKGYTEIPANSLTAVSLGIMTRKEAKKYIKRLQIL